MKSCDCARIGVVVCAFPLHLKESVSTRSELRLGAFGIIIFFSRRDMFYTVVTLDDGWNVLIYSMNEDGFIQWQGLEDRMYSVITLLLLR